MKLKYLPLITLVIFLGGCATGYHSRSFNGGYSEIMTNQDSFIVTFSGNRYTSGERTMRYALLRAAELTLNNGYKYFAILSSVDQTSSYNYSNTSGNALGSGNSFGYSSFTYSGSIVKPGISIRIKCFKEKTQRYEVIDARFYLDTNSEE
jgi:hypothetical protein